MSKQLSSFDKVHEEENSKLILEHVVHGNDEWVLNVVENFFFKLERCKRVILDNNIFSNTFHCVNFLCFNMLYLKHFSKCTFTYDSNQLEIFKNCVFSIFLFKHGGGSNGDALLDFVLTIWVFFFSIVWSIVLNFKFVLLIRIIIIRWGCFFGLCLSLSGIFFQ